LAERLKAKPVQTGHAILRQPQGTKRQLGHGGRLVTGRHHSAVVTRACQCASRVENAGDHRLCGNATAREVGADARKEGLFSAKQIGAAGDIQHQAIRRIAGGKGCETERPERQPLEERHVGAGIGRPQDQIGMHRLGVGKSLPWSEGGAGRVHTHEQAAVSVRAPGGDGLSG
jgi:hypothetical protein